jgi:hypothetical protein
MRNSTDNRNQNGDNDHMNDDRLSYLMGENSVSGRNKANFGEEKNQNRDNGSDHDKRPEPDYEYSDVQNKYDGRRTRNEIDSKEISLSLYDLAALPLHIDDENKYNNGNGKKKDLSVTHTPLSHRHNDKFNVKEYIQDDPLAAFQNNGPEGISRYNVPYSVISLTQSEPQHTLPRYNTFMYNYIHIRIYLYIYIHNPLAAFQNNGPEGIFIHFFMCIFMFI